MECKDCHHDKDVNEFYIKNPKTGRRDTRCKQCSNDLNREKHLQYYYDHREEFLGQQHSYTAANKEKVYARKAAERQRRKAEVMSHYGGKCACCGETELAFLAIDHISGGGNKHRKTLRNGKKGGPCGGGCFYRWLQKNNYPPGYQVLCHNCNQASAWGVCPHKLSTAQGV